MKSLTGLVLLPVYIRHRLVMRLCRLTVELLMNSLPGDTCSEGKGNQFPLTHLLSDFALRSSLRTLLQGRLKTAIRGLSLFKCP